MAAVTPHPAPPATDRPARVLVLTVWIDGARTSPAVGDTRCGCTARPLRLIRPTPKDTR